MCKSLIVLLLTHHVTGFQCCSALTWLQLPIKTLLVLVIWLRMFRCLLGLLYGLIIAAESTGRQRYHFPRWCDTKHSAGADEEGHIWWSVGKGHRIFSVAVAVSDIEGISDVQSRCEEASSHCPKEVSCCQEASSQQGKPGCSTSTSSTSVTRERGGRIGIGV